MSNLGFAPNFLVQLEDIEIIQNTGKAYEVENVKISQAIIKRATTDANMTLKKLEENFEKEMNKDTANNEPLVKLNKRFGVLKFSMKEMQKVLAKNQTLSKAVLNSEKIHKALLTYTSANFFGLFNANCRDLKATEINKFEWSAIFTFLTLAMKVDIDLPLDAKKKMKEEDKLYIGMKFTTQVLQANMPNKKLKTGDKLVFKQFRSSSWDSSVAYDFAEGNPEYGVIVVEGFVEWKESIKAGTYVGHHSIKSFVDQKEVLISPFVEFEVIDLIEIPKNESWKLRIKPIKLHDDGIGNLKFD